MKKTILLVSCMFALMLLAFAAPSFAEDEIDISAKGVVVMDADTGQVLISRNMDLMLPPASTTKVMTAMLALGKADMTDTFKVSRRAAGMSPSRVNLRAGDEITEEALLYSVLLKSANDASAALAEGIAGSESLFASMMTEKAKELGALNTNFLNSSGLPEEGHYSTAYDMALIFRAAMQDPRFMDIATTKFATLNMGRKEKMLLRNHNRLLWCYEGAGPGKTGYTIAARHCYVGEANCANTRLIVAIMRSYDPWNDVRKLLDKGFELAMSGRTIALEDTNDQPVFKKASYTKRSRHHRKSRKARRHKRRRSY